MFSQHCAFQMSPSLWNTLNIPPSLCHLPPNVTLSMASLSKCHTSSGITFKIKSSLCHIPPNVTLSLTSPSNCHTLPSLSKYHPFAAILIQIHPTAAIIFQIAPFRCHHLRNVTLPLPSPCNSTLTPLSPSTWHPSAAITLQISPFCCQHPPNITLSQPSPSKFHPLAPPTELRSYISWLSFTHRLVFNPNKGAMALPVI